MSSTDQDWEIYGQQDPYYGVYTRPKFLGRLSPELKREFMETGELYVSSTINKSVSLFGEMNNGRALDFGCGVGRLAVPLSRRFNEVVGVDISKSMLAEAAINCSEGSVNNLSFTQSLDEVRGTFDFVNSYIVLQHIPVYRGMKIIAGLLDRVAPSGRAVLHVSLRRDYSVLEKLKYFAKHNIWGVRQSFNLLRGFPANRPAMLMNEYDLLRVIECFHARGFETALEIEDHRKLADNRKIVTAKVFGRRSAA
jgi:SAM-dependent methyltransferase